MPQSNVIKDAYRTLVRRPPRLPPLTLNAMRLGKGWD